MEKQNSIADKILIGSLLILLGAEAVHMAALILNLPFSLCAVMMAVLFVCLGLVSLFAFLWIRRHKKQNKTDTVVNDGVSFLTLIRLYPCLTLFLAGVIIFQIIWNFWMHSPYLLQDATGETVQTMLATDTIYKVNPFTGQAFVTGMPMRLKILVLPTLCAVVCKWTGLSAVAVCYRIVPMIVLLLSYMVYSRFAVYLFPKEGKKQLWFMLFVAFIYQFGCYSPVADSFLLFFQGGQGAAIRACVLLPFALLCCLKKEWIKVVLCLLAEVCVVWTFYGMGYVVLTVCAVGCIRGIQYLADRRKKV